MAKKQTKKTEVETPQLVASNEMQQVIIEKEVKTSTKKEPTDGWEVKDRVYYLKSKRKPLSYSIRSSGLYFFDEEKGYERELKYTSNQRTVFVDEMQGDQRLEHIIFRSGALYVPRNKTVLQKFLSLYHPQKNNLFYEYKPQAIAENQIDIIELELEALNAAKNLDIDMAEAVMRVEIGSKVTEMSSKELKRDLLLYAKKLWY